MTDLRDLPTWEMKTALDAWRLHRPELSSIWEKVADLIHEVDRLRREQATPQSGASGGNISPADGALRHELGYLLAAYFSGNRQPCMSGDPRDRLNQFQRRDMEDAITSILKAGFTKPPA
jgi:hypothetical protein